MFFNLFRKNHNALLLVTNFISGMSIMALEITAARLLAPYFGTSLFVWTNIIGVVLIALSFGYYYGGKYADKNPTLKALYAPMLIAGIVFLIVPWIVKPLSTLITIRAIQFTSSSLLVFVGSFLVTLILFAFPIFLLGMISPFVIRLYKTGSSNLGSAAGTIFAISTLGSILGTFLPTLLLIPTVGSHITINIFATALIVVSIIGLGASKLKFLIIPLVALPLLSVNAAAVKPAEDVIYETESSYQYLQVQENEKGIRHLVFNEGGGIQSVYNPDSYLSGYYYDYFLPLLNIPSSSAPKQVAVLGLSGGTISREINHYFGDKVHTDGVEIDKKVIEVAKKYFDLENPNLNVINQDAHIFIRNTENKYDLIIVDAYANQLYIPWNLTTQEFWTDIKSKLTKNGIVTLNVNSTNDDSPLLQSIANTMAKVYPYTYVARVDAGTSWNYFILSSEGEIPLADLPSYGQGPDLLPLANELAVSGKRFTHDPSKMILTADRAPVEMMTDAMIFDYVKNRL